MRHERDMQSGFDWVEARLGGKIVGRRRLERWRPQWFLDVDTGSEDVKRVVMKGFRTPGYATPDEASARAMLRVEAQMLETLQTLPVQVPDYLGYDPDGGWMLMSLIDGDSELTAICDASRRYTIFRGYMEDIARLHSQMLETTKVPADLFVPKSVAEIVDLYLNQNIARFRAQGQRPLPEPSLEFGIQWLADHPLTSERPMRLGLGDIGPNQFLFKGDQYRALLDFEYAMVSDPLMEIGLMRSRDMTYPTGRMGEHIDHYGQFYESLTGDALDLDALHYWTVFGVVAWPLVMNPALQKPDPRLLDQTFLYSWEIHHRRCIPESLAEQYGIVLEMPELPPVADTGETVLGPLHELLIGQFEGHYADLSAGDGADSAFARYSAAVARCLARGAAVGARLNHDNLDELGELLGHRPDSMKAGLFELEAKVAADYEADFEKRIRFFHKFELRKEYLYEPMQIATGCASRSPLGHLVKRHDAASHHTLPVRAAA